MEGEFINQGEDVRTAFFSMKYPFSDTSVLQLKRTICSFLNCEGGKLYIGINKVQAGKRQVLV